MVLKSTCQLPIILTLTILKYGVSFCLLLFTDRKVNKEENNPAPLSLKHITFQKKKFSKFSLHLTENYLIYLISINKDEFLNIQGK